MRNSLFRDLYVRRRDLSLQLADLTFQSVNSALSQKLKVLLHQDPLSFVNSTISPMDYVDAETFKRDYLCVEMFSKFPYLETGINRTEVALKKFSESEALCRETNIRLASAKNYSFRTTSVFETARRKIAKLLGPFTWDEACLGFDFGPGGTTRVRKIRADRYYKLSGKPDSTANCLGLADACLRYFSAWGTSVNFEVNCVVGNKIVTVPKNAKTDRVIAIEPDMNIFVQKGIGKMIRNRLKKVKVDLNDQTLNQELAFMGSLDGSLATIDLSAASDCISLEIVRELLPPEWVDALHACRSERGVLPSGDIVVYQKISSMGNGFTFELESLIFWALCAAVRSLSTVTDRRMAIYGDDIIVPTALASDVIDILSFAGFQPNVKKTHISGPFRESCGKHYFNGIDVSPIYVKDRVDSYPRFIWLHNQLKRWSWNRVFGLDPMLKPVVDEILSNMKGWWARPRISDGYGDGALIGDFDEVLPKRAPLGHCGWETTFFSETRETGLPDDLPILLKSLFMLEVSKTSVFRVKSGRAQPWAACREFPAGSAISLLPVASTKRVYRKAKKAVWQWHDLGPWLA